jgi:hypothetical protein
MPANLPVGSLKAQHCGSEWALLERPLLTAQRMRVAPNIRIPKPLHRAIQLYCLRNDLMIRDFITYVLGEALKRTSEGESQ